MYKMFSVITSTKLWISIPWNLFIWRKTNKGTVNLYIYTYYKSMIIYSWFKFSFWWKNSNLLLIIIKNLVWNYCVCRRDVLDELVTLHNFSNQFLPNALRDFFRHIHAPEERGEYLETLITKFSHRFCACNPTLVQEVGLSPGKWSTTQS